MFGKKYLKFSNRLYYSFMLSCLLACNLQAQQTEMQGIASALCFPLLIEDFIKVSSSFGYRFHPLYKKQIHHNGIDLVAQLGNPVYATSTGLVIKSCFSKGYGNHIIIAHDYSLKTLYAHLSLRTVKEGDLVTKGQLIGLVGDSGNTTGVHLHYETWFENKPINPMNLWQGLYMI